MTSLTTVLAWRERGEQRMLDEVDALRGELGEPTLLPGWTRADLLAHVAVNAGALVNLLQWARTGTETPMYRSPEHRREQIAALAGALPVELRRSVHVASTLLSDAIEQLPGPAWEVPVRTAQGRTVPAGDVPWMRCREVWVHAVDLDAGFGFDAMPEDVLEALATDVVATWGRRDGVPDLAVEAGERRWGTAAPGAPLVTGSLSDVTAWLTGRSDGTGLVVDGVLPTIPAWL